MAESRKQETRARLGWRDQDGFNLLGALATVSLVVLVTYLVAQSQSLSIAAKRNVRAAGAFEEIIQPFQSAVVEKLRTHFTATADPGCPTSATFATGIIGTSYLFTFQGSGTSAPSAPDSWQKMKTSCGKARFQNGNFKFCLDIKPIGSTSATSNNMAAMSDIVAELDISLLDVQDNQPLTCTAFYQGRAAYTVRVDYTLNWLTTPKGPTAPLHKKRRGSFYAIL